MSLPHALLTSLLERPASGLDLANRFDRSIGYFWSATHQQIYRELGLMEKAGWIKSLPPETGRGRKKVYKVLQKGRKELVRWVNEQEDAGPMRSELMVRLRAEAIIGPTGLSDEIRRQYDIHAGKLEVYREIEKRDFSKHEMSRREKIQHVVLKAGIMYEQHWMDICRIALESLAADEPD